MRSPEEMAKLIEKLKAEVASLKTQLTSNGLTPLTGSNSKISPSPTLTSDSVQTKEESKIEEHSSMTLSQNITGHSPSEEVSSSALSHPKEVEDNKRDVSFNTLLNDSTLSFNLDSETRGMVPEDP